MSPQLPPPLALEIDCSEAGAPAAARAVEPAAAVELLSEEAPGVEEVTTMGSPLAASGPSNAVTCWVGEEGGGRGGEVAKSPPWL